MNKRFKAYVDAQEYKKYDGQYASRSFLRLPLWFDDPVRLAEFVETSYHHIDKQFASKFPNYQVLAIYTTSSEEEEQVMAEASASSAEEFFVVDVTIEACPVLLWTPDTPFFRMPLIAPSLDQFLSSLQ